MIIGETTNDISRSPKPSRADDDMTQDLTRLGLIHVLRFCHGCVLREQLRVSENSEGRVPKWLKCMTCRENTSFRPDEPKYHRLLIDLLGRAHRYASAQVKQEQECKISFKVCSETDEVEETVETEQSKARDEGQLDKRDSHKHDNRFKDDSEPLQRSNQDVTVKLEEFTLENPLNPEEKPELMDEIKGRFKEETFDEKPSTHLEPNVDTNEKRMIDQVEHEQSKRPRLAASAEVRRKGFDINKNAVTLSSPVNADGLSLRCSLAYSRHLKNGAKPNEISHDGNNKRTGKTSGHEKDRVFICPRCDTPFNSMCSLKAHHGGAHKSKVNISKVKVGLMDSSGTVNERFDSIEDLERGLSSSYHEKMNQRSDETAALPVAPTRLSNQSSSRSPRSDTVFYDVTEHVAGRRKQGSGRKEKEIGEGMEYPINSQIIVYAHNDYWRATVKGYKRKKNTIGYIINYDGTAKSKRIWIKPEAIVGLH